MLALLLAHVVLNASNLTLSSLPDDAALANLLWESAPAMQPARARLGQARADVGQSHVLPNPGLDVSANTLPVGPSNPPDLANPLGNVPNYAFALSTLVELGKRGPRQDAANASLDAAIYDGRDALLGALIDLKGRIAEVAASEMRVAVWESLAVDAAHLTSIQAMRASKGDASALDADRSKLEEEKLRQNMAEERGRLAAALRACTELLGAPCEAFGSAEAASAWLTSAKGAALSEIDARSDVRSLRAQAKSLESKATLAARRAIPDPTLRLGYVRDQFVASGNQQNSLFVGVSLPLPVFDHGQHDAEAARVASRVLSVQAESVARAARQSVAGLQEEGARLRERQSILKGESIPLAKSIVERLTAAVARGAATVPELLMARRTLGDLLIDEAEIAGLVFKNITELQHAAGQAPPWPAELNNVGETS